MNERRDEIWKNRREIVGWLTTPNLSWPAAQSLRIEGCTLRPFDRQVFTALMEHLDEAGIATTGRHQLLEQLGRSDNESAWDEVKQSVSQLMTWSVGFCEEDPEKSMHLVNSMREAERVLKVGFSQDLLLAYLDARTAELTKSVLQAQDSTRAGLAEASKTIAELAFRRTAG